MNPAWMSPWILPGGLPGARAAPDVARHRLLVLVGGEERDQVEEREGGVDHPVEPGLRDAELAAQLDGLARVAESSASSDSIRALTATAVAPVACGVRGDRIRHLVGALVDVCDVEDRLRGERLEQARSIGRLRRERARRGPAARTRARRPPPRASPARRPPPCRAPWPAWSRAPAGVGPARGRRRAARARSARCRRRDRSGPPDGARRPLSGRGRRGRSRPSRGSQRGSGCRGPRPRRLRGPGPRCRGTRSSRARPPTSPTVSATRSSRSSGTATTATFGSIVVNG